MFKAFFKYCTAGSFATMVHYALFFIAINAKWLPWQATMLAASIGALVAYIFNYKFTFLSNEKHHVLLPKFLIVAALGVIMQTIVVALFNQRYGLNFLISQVIATIAGLLFTFLVNSLWTFA